MISNAAHPDATIIWGAAFDENLQDEMKITVVATGFDSADSTGVINVKKPVTEVSFEKKPEPAEQTNLFGNKEVLDIPPFIDKFNQ